MGTRHTLDAIRRHDNITERQHISQEKIQRHGHRAEDRRKNAKQVLVDTALIHARHITDFQLFDTGRDVVDVVLD